MGSSERIILATPELLSKMPRYGENIEILAGKIMEQKGVSSSDVRRTLVRVRRDDFKEAQSELTEALFRWRYGVAEGSLRKDDLFTIHDRWAPGLAAEALFFGIVGSSWKDRRENCIEVGNMTQDKDGGDFVFNTGGGSFVVDVTTSVSRNILMQKFGRTGVVPFVVPFRKGGEFGHETVDRVVGVFNTYGKQESDENGLIDPSIAKSLMHELVAVNMKMLSVPYWRGILGKQMVEQRRQTLEWFDKTFGVGVLVSAA
jgi:hypothetical protein